MTDVARQVDPSCQDDPDDEVLLPVPSDGVPQTILVKVLSVAKDGTPTVGFALPASPSYVTGGMTWQQCGENYGQFLSFLFQPGAATILEVLPPVLIPPPVFPPILVSRPAGPDTAPTSQQGAVANALGTFSFSVRVQLPSMMGVAGGGDVVLVDPKIVVTPLTQKPPPTP